MIRKLVRLGIAGGLVAAAMFAPAVGTVAASPNIYASVSAAGTLVNGNGATAVSHAVGTGQYEVAFSSNVSGCAYVATTHNASGQALQAYTAGGHASATNGVYVEVKNQGGGLTDGAFNLAVACAMRGWQFAVVGYTANLVRSSGATLVHSGQGKYTVTFPSAVSKCAYLATVGDPAHALVFAPSGVYTASGGSSTSVAVETKNPGGGLQDGVPFHLAVVCNNAISAHNVVVQASGLPSRGSTLTSSFNASTGNYDIVTNTSLAACTVIATRGSVNTAVPFSPSTVEVTAGPAANTSGIQVRTLLFFGGALDNQSFHAAAVC